MTIATFFDKTITIERLADVAGDDNEKYASHLTGIDCQIQPLEGTPVESLEGAATQDFLMVTKETDIKIKDKVKDGSIEYGVVGVESYDFEGEEHLEVTIRLQK